jgi:hypothetical protein
MCDEVHVCYFSSSLSGVHIGIYFVLPAIKNKICYTYNAIEREAFLL